MVNFRCVEAMRSEHDFEYVMPIADGSWERLEREGVSVMETLLGIGQNPLGETSIL